MYVLTLDYDHTRGVGHARGIERKRPRRRFYLLQSTRMAYLGVECGVGSPSARCRAAARWRFLRQPYSMMYSMLQLGRVSCMLQICEISVGIVP